MVISFDSSEIDRTLRYFMGLEGIKIPYLMGKPYGWGSDRGHLTSTGLSLIVEVDKVDVYYLLPLTKPLIPS